MLTGNFRVAAAFAVATVAAGLHASGSGAVAQERVGVTGAVNPDATGQPPTLPVRTLLLGSDVVYNETIRTQANGQAQILFVDRSSFSVGPNAEVVIDEFVYNKDSGTGRLLASAAKGAFRFVGGALSKSPEGVQLKTPAATIGIRGGVFVADIAPDGRTTATFLYGREMTVTAQGQVQRVLRPGFAVTVAPGGSPGMPFKAPSAQVLSTVAQLDGRPGGDGGATEIPSAAQFLQSGVPAVISYDVQQSRNDAVRASGGGSRRSQQTQQAAVYSSGNLSDGSTGTPTGGVQASQIKTVETTGAIREIATFSPFDPSVYAFDVDFVLKFSDFSFSDPAISAAQYDLFYYSTTDLSPVLPQGTATDVASLPMQGRASFSGPIIGSVTTDGGQSFIRATGTYTQTWDFGLNAGGAAITGYAGHDFTGKVQALDAASRNAFYGILAGGGINVRLTGSFYDDTAGRAYAEAHGGAYFLGPGFASFAVFKGTR
ncbi:MAG TPA: FecR domain-containing protein [Stellaceae bacterium]